MGLAFCHSKMVVNFACWIENVLPSSQLFVCRFHKLFVKSFTQEAGFETSVLWNWPGSQDDSGRREPEMCCSFGLWWLLWGPNPGIFPWPSGFHAVDPLCLTIWPLDHLTIGFHVQCPFVAAHSIANPGGNQDGQTWPHSPRWSSIATLRMFEKNDVQTWSFQDITRERRESVNS